MDHIPNPPTLYGGIIHPGAYQIQGLVDGDALVVCSWQHPYGIAFAGVVNRCLDGRIMASPIPIDDNYSTRAAYRYRML